MKFTIVHLYPDLLNLYGDYGNIASLCYRLKSRGIEVDVRGYSIDENVDFNNVDIVYLGGGAEKEQLMVCKKLLESKDKLLSYVENNGVLLATCNGFEILGESFQTKNETHIGLGIINIKSTWNEARFIDDVVIESELISAKIVGFENHNSRITIGSYQPLGKVLFGNGNNGEDKNEGVVYKNLIGTFLHGPLLPKNPKLTDYLIVSALKNRGETIQLSNLDDTEENLAHDYVLNCHLK